MSLIETKNIAPNRYELTIQVGAEAFEAALERAYRKQKKDIVLPGFRKGKAPRMMVEKIHGESVFFEDAVDELYFPAMIAAIEEAKLEVVVRPTVEVSEVARDTGFSFVATCITKPEVTVKDYFGLAVEKESAMVGEEEIDKKLQLAQEQHARMVEVTDRPAKDGDTLTFDFEGFVDGVPFEGGEAENFELTLGSGQFIPGFEAQMEGHIIGEPFDVNVSFPEEYHAEELKGKPARFACTIHSIQAKELPALDDEFAKDVSEFDTLAEYRADLSRSLTEEKEQRATQEVENSLIDAVIERTEGEIPQELNDLRIDEMVKDFSHRLEAQGMNLETYLQYTGMEESSFRLTFAEQAEKQVKIGLALEKIVEIEKIEIDDATLDAEYEKMAEQYKMEVARVKELVSADSLRKDLASQQAVEKIKETAVVTEISGDEQSTAAPEEETVTS